MSVSEKLKKAVAEKDFVAIRDSLWSRIALDPNFTNGFAESWEYCLNSGISESDLYENHDNRPMSDEITNENFSALCGELSTNFSKERLNKIKEIGRKLYPPTDEKIRSQTSGTQNSGQRRTPTGSASNKSDGDSRLLIAGLAIGAIAGGLLGGFIFGKAVAAGIGAITGAAVGGAAGAKLSKK
ncbi:MAG TPA: hypothetical protein DCZ76_04080 [Treponema sp.]|nr:hypothetical protein [Treponema sp.]